MNADYFGKLKPRAVKTGRGVRIKKPLVEHSLRFDVLLLHREGVFEQPPGFRGQVTWALGKKPSDGLSSVGFCLEGGPDGPAALRLFYTVRGANGAGVGVSYLVDLDFTPCRFGGGRWWLLCPAVTERGECRRRCAKLYLPPGEEFFACRRCHDLTYEARQRRGEKYFEHLVKPWLVTRRMMKKAVRSRSPEARARAWRKVKEMRARLKEFTRK